MREEWVGYSLKFGLPRPGWPAGEVPGPQTCCLLWLEMALEWQWVPSDERGVGSACNALRAQGKAL